jgi:transposase-like protein
MGRPKGTKNVMRTPEEKETLIKDYYKSDLSYKDYAETHGVSDKLFRKWAKIYLSDGLKGLKSQTGKGPGNLFAALHTSKKLTEMDRLRLENMRKDIVIARLKKGYFVKGAGSKKEYVSIKKKNTK